LPKNRGLFHNTVLEEAGDHEPDDCIERKLARMIAKVNGNPYPYGTKVLSEAERRACVVGLLREGTPAGGG